MAFNIIIDTREQKPWDFANADVVTTRKKVEIGDYTIEGLENRLCIERKRNVSEFIFNFTEDRFHRLIKKIQAFEWKYILLEFSIDDVMLYPINSGIPDRQLHKVKLKGDFLLKCISKLQVYYDIHVLFCGDADNAKIMALNIMKQVIEKVKENDKK